MFRTLRKLSAFAALLAAFGGGPSPARACLPGGGDGRPAVEVLGHGWKRHVHSPWLETTNWYVEADGSDVEGFKYKAVVRNNARRAVRAVEWEYRFVRLADGALVSSHRFTTSARIKPGKTKELSAFSVTPPTRLLDAASANGGRAGLAEQIAIRAVVFEDGSRQTF